MTRRRALAGGVLACGVAGAAVALALTLPGDVAPGPKVVQAAALAERAATRPAPAVSRTRPGWRARGARTDDLAGRRVVTVLYARDGSEAGYTIVPAPVLPPPVATRARLVAGVTYRWFTAGGRTIVTWVRAERTLVLSGRGVPAGALLALAARLTPTRAPAARR